MSSFAIIAASAASVREDCNASLVKAALLSSLRLCISVPSRAVLHGRAAACHQSDRQVATAVSRRLRVPEHRPVRASQGVLPETTAGASVAPAFSSSDRTGCSLPAPGSECAGQTLTRTLAGASLSQRVRLCRQAPGDRAAVPAYPFIPGERR